ncbi:bifunctional DNA primase/polymerase [Streptomyces capparidis]
MTELYDDANEWFLAALDAAGRGWHVFPLRPYSKRPALHGAGRCPGTGPCARGHAPWEQQATDDADRIESWWAGGAAWNVGIATGPSNLVVVDLDMPKSGKSKADTPTGVANFKALCERAGQPVPTTFRVRTASGGWHLYFTAPPGIRLTNTAGRLAPLIDTRAWGGYVVAPGSYTDAGEYTAYGSRVAPLPQWLLDALLPAPRPNAPAPAPALRNVPGYVAAALRNETANVARAVEGTRNRTLVRAARALGRFVASGDLPRAVVEQALKEAGEAAGLSSRECGPAITSALNWSIAHNPGRGVA